MKHKLHILSSGSKANAYLVDTSAGILVIDQGLSCRAFMKKCGEIGVDTSRIKAIAVTHEHSDHIKGVARTAAALHVPVLASEKIIPLITEQAPAAITCVPIKKETPVSVAGISLTAFPVQHDAVDPLGFFLAFTDGETLAFTTDTGKVTTHIMRYLSLSSSIVIEANHDPAMLYHNPRYPWYLKQRIRGNDGHLSNDQCLDALAELSAALLKNVIMAHLSEENNSPALLRKITVEFIEKKSFTFSHYIADQYNPFSVLLQKR